MASLPDILLRWYDREARTLPWRTAQGQADPYKVWLSEIMLQQTTVATVAPYFHAFLKRWPTLPLLAAASLDEILHAWQGLGYYSRARQLKKCADDVMQHHAGTFPATAAELERLPGIGPYTAAAIASIAFGQSIVPVDGNIIRVISRLYTLKTPQPKGRAEVDRLAQTFAHPHRPGDVAQALMDLGATLCTPKNPTCDQCPLMPHCLAKKEGSPALYPLKAPKVERPTRHATAYCLQRADGAILLEKRPESGLLGGMLGLPTTPWETAEPIPIAPPWIEAPQTVKHVFTHFTLIVRPAVRRATHNEPGLWVHPSDLSNHALPTLMKKVIAASLEHLETL